MTASKPPKFLLTAAELAAAPERHLRHPFNPRSDVYLRSLGRPVGLKRLSLSLARVPPGGESFIYHAHEHDEEFVYILSGRVDDAGVQPMTGEEWLAEKPARDGQD